MNGPDEMPRKVIISAMVMVTCIQNSIHPVHHEIQSNGGLLGTREWFCLKIGYPGEFPN